MKKQFCQANSVSHHVSAMAAMAPGVLALPIYTSESCLNQWIFQSLQAPKHHVPRQLFVYWMIKLHQWHWCRIDSQQIASKFFRFRNPTSFIFNTFCRKWFDPSFLRNPWIFPLPPIRCEVLVPVAPKHVEWLGRFECWSLAQHSLHFHMHIKIYICRLFICIYFNKGILHTQVNIDYRWPNVFWGYHPEGGIMLWN